MAVVVNVVGNFDDKEIKRAQRELAKLSPASKKTSSGFGQNIGKMTKALGTFALGTVALKQVADGFVNIATAAQESLAVSRTTEAIIKSTGGVAKVTAEQVNALSTALSNKTGIDDETIQRGANLLLTFKNVRNEIGKGNQIFDRATIAAADLSAAGFGSLESASKMLGKALNDPVAGVTALSRAGVTFSAQQKEQIKALVETGKTLEAQKLIMAEVESQVGGVAEAAASPLERLRTMWGNFQEDLGGKLLPVISQVADALGPILMQVAGPLGDVLGKVATTLAGALQQLVPILDPIAKAFGVIAEVVGNTLTAALDAILPVLMPILDQFAKLISNIAPIVAPILAKIAELFGAILQALAPLIPPLIKVINQIFKAAAPILTAVIDVLIGVVKAFAPLIPIIAKLLPPLTRLVLAVFKAIMPILKPLMPIIEALANVLAVVLTEAVLGLTDALNTLLPYFEKAIGWVGNFAGSIIKSIGDLPSKMLDVGKNIVTGLWDGISGAGSWLKAKVMEWAGDLLPGWVKDILGIQSPSRVFMKIGGFVSEGMAKGIIDAAGSVKKAAQEMGKTAIDAATDALQRFRDTAAEFFDLRNSIRDSLTGFGSIGSVQIGDGFAPNAQGILAQMQDRLSKIREFGKSLRSLKGLGLNNASLQEIIAAGPEAGSQIAAALLAEGQKAIREVNSLEAQIRVDSTRVGTIGAESAFGMTAANARGLQTTTVNMREGAVVLNFGSGTSRSDAQEIQRAVEQAIKQALKQAAQDAKR